MEIPWQERELARIETGENERMDGEIYRMMVGENGAIPGTYPYVSKEDNGKARLIAYTKTEEHGRADRQTRTTIDKYLIAMGIAEAPRQQISAKWRAKYGIKKLIVLTEPAEIVDAYQYGPRSCMADAPSGYETDGIHPVSVYGGNTDTGLAILRDTNGNISARVIVRLSARKYGRTYGDDAIVEALHSEKWKAGEYQYRESDHYLDGVKLPRININNGDNVLMPYLDGAVKVDLTDTHCILSSCGEYEAKQTDGRLWVVHECRWCNDNHVQGGCECSGRSEDSSDCVCTGCETELFWCERCESEYCGESYSVGNETVCESCSEYYGVCYACDSIVPIEDMQTDGDNDYCEGCWEDKEEEEEEEEESPQEVHESQIALSIE
jgi:hypothetical protein